MKRQITLTSAAMIFWAFLASASTTSIIATAARYQQAQRTHAPMYLRQHHAGHVIAKSRSVSPHQGFRRLSTPTMNLGFFAASAIPTGGQTFGAAAVGDFDGDGKQDVAVNVDTHRLLLQLQRSALCRRPQWRHPRRSRPGPQR